MRVSILNYLSLKNFMRLFATDRQQNQSVLKQFYDTKKEQAKASKSSICWPLQAFGKPYCSLKSSI